MHVVPRLLVIFLNSILLGQIHDFLQCITCPATTLLGVIGIAIDSKQNTIIELVLEIKIWPLKLVFS
jgi:hypothetical protein